MNGKGRGNGNDSRRRDDNGDEDEDEGKKNRKKNVDKTVVWLVVMGWMGGEPGRTDFHALATENGYLGSCGKVDQTRLEQAERLEAPKQGGARTGAGLVGRNAQQAPQHPTSQWQRLALARDLD